MERMIPVERPLTPEQQFRLVVIAHETRSAEIRAAALKVLWRCLNPLMFVAEKTEDPSAGPNARPASG